MKFQQAKVKIAHLLLLRGGCDIATFNTLYKQAPNLPQELQNVKVFAVLNHPGWSSEAFHGPACWPGCRGSAPSLAGLPALRGTAPGKDLSHPTQISPVALSKPALDPWWWSLLSCTFYSYSWHFPSFLFPFFFSFIKEKSKAEILLCIPIPNLIYVLTSLSSIFRT